MPGLLFVAPAAALIEQGRRGPAMVLAGISNLYTAALVAAWGSESCTSCIPSHRTLHYSAAHLVLRSRERAMVVPCEQGSAGRRQ